jgi:hypothetical protein
MIRFDKALHAWNTPEFAAVLKEEIEHLDADLLPLQQGLARSSHVAPRRPGAMIIGVTADGDFIHARAGIFYAGIIAGCSCADDPTPVDEIDEYCEIAIGIDRRTAEATITLL